MKRLNDETKCGNFKDTLTECGSIAFKKANSELGYQFE